MPLQTAPIESVFLPSAYAVDQRPSIPVTNPLKSTDLSGQNGKSSAPIAKSK
jgi:hypothetical protein